MPLPWQKYVTPPPLVLDPRLKPHQSPWVDNTQPKTQDPCFCVLQVHVVSVVINGGAQGDHVSRVYNEVNYHVMKRGTTRGHSAHPSPDRQCQGKNPVYTTQKFPSQSSIQHKSPTKKNSCDKYIVRVSEQNHRLWPSRVTLVRGSKSRPKHLRF